ncbi:MAG: LacI family DNA-binding transcriptional regulator [Clostridia bacterium]|nr:LacI family DNA-binding transcriptional regulator [Clostridia bacterium]
MGITTLRDVAREAGVSVATASNAMNNPSVVRPETRKLVLEAAAKLAYIPNVNGQRLRARESRTIGLFVRSMTGEYYCALADQMFRACQEQGYEVHICMVTDTRSILKKLGERTLDGAVVFCDDLEADAPARMETYGIPLLFLGLEREEAHTSCILYESEAQGRMAADYLLGLGKKRLLHIFGLPGNLDSEKRWIGFREELRNQGMKNAKIPVLYGMFERASAYREMRKYLLEGHQPPDAIFAANDLSAIGCMAALNEMGYRVPEDVSVLGCDDITLCEYITPALTTIRTNFWDTGTLAADEVIRLIRGEAGRTIRQSGNLVIRKSCALS